MTYLIDRLISLYIPRSGIKVFEESLYCFHGSCTKLHSLTKLCKSPLFLATFLTLLVLLYLFIWLRQSKTYSSPSVSLGLGPQVCTAMSSGFCLVYRASLPVVRQYLSVACLFVSWMISDQLNLFVCLFCFFIDFNHL